VAAQAAAAAATVVKDVPASGWIVGGLLVAGAGYLWYRTVGNIFGGVKDFAGDAADAVVDAGKATIDVFEDAGSAVVGGAQAVGSKAIDEVQDIGSFLGQVGANADKAVSNAVDNAISDVRASAVVVKANQVRRNAFKGVTRAGNKVSNSVKKSKSKAKKALKRFRRRF